MKSNILKIGLLLSLSFNLGFLGAIGYRFFENRKVEKGRMAHRVLVQYQPDSNQPMMRFEMAPDQEEKIMHRRMDFQPRVHDIRLKLHDERVTLTDILMKEPVDTGLIIGQIEKISRLQSEIEKEVVFQLLHEKAELTPEQRRRFVRIVVDQINGAQLGPQPIAEQIFKHRFIDGHGKIQKKIEIFQEKKEK
jgi:hypothetical protein